MPDDHPLVLGVSRANQELYGEPLRPGACGYSTNGVAFCGRHHLPGVIIGPGDVAACHRPNETTRVSDLVKCGALYALLPYTL